MNNLRVVDGAHGVIIINERHIEKSDRGQQGADCRMQKVPSRMQRPNKSKEYDWYPVYDPYETGKLPEALRCIHDFQRSGHQGHGYSDDRRCLIIEVYLLFGVDLFEFGILKRKEDFR